MYYFPDEGQAFVQGDLYLGQCSCNEEPVASANAATHRTSSLNDIDAQCGMMLSDRSLSPVKDLWAESLNITWLDIGPSFMPYNNTARYQYHLKKPEVPFCLHL